MRGAAKAIPFLAAAILLPSFALAQGTLTGTVKESSGAVLPGVTVEATSPALIERVRSAVTDGTGQYRIPGLNPGTYSLTFRLSGFNVVKREGIELTGTTVLTIPIEMTVGTIAETVTVEGETPVVDVQSTSRETVLSADVVAAVPGNRSVGTLLNAVPGLVVNDGALATSPTMTFFAARGGPINEGRMAINGMTIAAPFNGGGVSTYILDSINVDEISVAVAGGLGESDIGGPIMNLVPRSGGNTYRGQAFINNAGDWSRGDNLTPELTAPPPGPISRKRPASSTRTTRASRTAGRSCAIDSGFSAAIAVWKRQGQYPASSTTRTPTTPHGGTGWQTRA
ncbi:MAG TPA: TonB-dependent receptor [Vicinamibacterales bacterium]|nr:TonB-dependent receptor [Vicinamibacterales bacterium]